VQLQNCKVFKNQLLRRDKMQSDIAVLMNRPFGGGPMDGMMRGGHPGGFFLGGLMTAVWAALIVLLVLWVIRNWSSPRNPITAFTRRAAAAVQASNPVAGGTQTPLEILQTRYAKGEINREEYETIRRDLTGETPSAPVPPVEVPPAQA
jgi:uncharacterized membrane protein